MNKAIPIPSDDVLRQRAEKHRIRTLSALRSLRRSDRRRSGLVPYGFSMVGDRLIKNPVEQRAITLMRTQRESGASFRAIARALDAGGFAPKYGGGKWSSVSVLMILRRLDRLDRGE